MTMDLQNLHDDLHKKIDEIDAKLDSQVDAKTAGKRAIVSDLIDSAKGTWTPVSEQLIGQLGSATEDVQIGVYYGLLRALNSAFSKKLSEAVDKKVEALPEATPADVIPEEVIKELSTARSELYAKVRQLVEMNETFNGGCTMHLPKRRTGGRGKRGPRAISSFNWTIDETAYENLKAVAEDYDQYEATKDLTKAMRDAKIDLKNPPDRIEFTLPDGKILVGVKDADKIVSPDNDPDNDGDDGDDDGDTPE